MLLYFVCNKSVKVQEQPESASNSHDNGPPMSVIVRPEGEIHCGLIDWLLYWFSQLIH